MKTSKFLHQLGLGLVELMVGLVVSTILLGGIIQIFVSSKMSYRALNGYSRLQENGRSAVDILSSNIRLAGYRSNILSSEETAFLTDGVFTQSNGQVVVGQDGAAGSPDSITFRYQGSGDGTGTPDGLIENCLGGDVDSGVTASITFNIDTTDNELECRVNGGIPQPMVDGVENMQILYGVDTSTPRDRSANTFNSATLVATNSQWNDVVSVRVALLLNTVARVSTRNDSKSYILNGVTIAATADRFRRHRFMTTINLRNRVRLQ